MLHSYTNASRTHSLTGRTELGIYKRQQESKKTRTRPRKRSRKQNKNSTKKAIKKTRKQEIKQELDQEKKKKKLSFFLDHFLGRVFVFLLSCFLLCCCCCSHESFVVDRLWKGLVKPFSPMLMGKFYVHIYMARRSTENYSLLPHPGN